MTGPSQLCLRCDWEGADQGATCPRCGAQLYREPEPIVEPPPAARLERAVPVVPDAPAEPSATPSAGPVPPRRFRRRTRLVAAVAASVLVAAGLWALGGGGDRPGRAPARTGTSAGTLIYASISRNGTDGRIWRFDLSSMRVRRGPRLVVPSSLVASGPGGRWVGVVAGHAAFQFRSLVAGALAHSFTFGDLVVWGPGGEQIFVASRSVGGAGCPGLRVASVDPLTGATTTMFSDRSCSHLLGMGVDGLSRPYLSLSGARTGVYLVGYKRLHLVVPRFTLLSISALGDMLVGPPAGDIGGGGGPAPVTRTLLVWKGVGGPLVIGTATHDLEAERVLAWSDDGHRALVVGTLAGLRSVWLVTSGPGTGRRRPVRVGPALPAGVTDVGATFAGPALLVDVAGTLYRSDRHGWREVSLPRGAPKPHGPLLWVPARPGQVAGR